MRQIVLDIQTTGLEPEQGHRVVEIAVVEIIDRRLTGSTFHRYIRPGRELNSEMIQETGITDEFLASQPWFEEIAEDFLEYVGDAELLIHNADFQLAFINAELRRTSKDTAILGCRSVVDTLGLATKLHPGEINNLESLCARYGVNVSSDTFRGGLGDAALLAQLYIDGFASLRLDISKAISSEVSIWTPDMEHELLLYLRRNPKGVFELSPRRFEELIASIFRNNGFSVELTPQTRDGGVDIIAVQHSSFTGDTINLVECKRYAPSHSVGIGVVQRLLGTVTQRRATKGIVVATSRFTRDARRVAEETRHLITLNDYNSIVGWLQDKRS